MERVSRAGNKIAEAAGAFRFDFDGKTVLDVGSSTGGFTEYALEHGAAKVIAVEIGKNQMKAPLRFDSRVELHEKTDIFGFSTDEKIDAVVADVSFVSLKDVLAHVRDYIAGPGAEYLVMLKPQFEAKPEQLNKGIVKNEKMRREIIKDFEFWLKNNGFLVLNKRDNETHGRHGNVERFYYLKAV
ncbi:TlyA family RNA methyltransferase [Candidatus Saccharibacteria bacterium]|nr:TlyA family RNA methyltransferase [Candidatus Saccharibacteria bacterium]